MRIILMRDYELPCTLKVIQNTEMHYAEEERVNPISIPVTKL